MRAIVPVTVPPDSDLDIVDEALKEACMTVKEEYKDQIISDPEVVGITNMDVNGVQFTITTIATPEEYFIVERAMRKEAVLSLHKRGITIATPRSVVVSTDQLKGSSKKE